MGCSCSKLRLLRSQSRVAPLLILGCSRLKLDLFQSKTWTALGPVLGYFGTNPGLLFFPNLIVLGLLLVSYWAAHVPILGCSLSQSFCPLLTVHAFHTSVLFLRRLHLRISPVLYRISSSLNYMSPQSPGRYPAPSPSPRTLKPNCPGLDPCVASLFMRRNASTAWFLFRQQQICIYCKRGNSCPPFFCILSCRQI
jgi:hypothetical protein